MAAGSRGSSGKSDYFLGKSAGVNGVLTGTGGAAKHSHREGAEDVFACVVGQSAEVPCAREHIEIDGDVAVVGGGVESERADHACTGIFGISFVALDGGGEIHFVVGTVGGEGVRAHGGTSFFQKGGRETGGRGDRIPPGESDKGEELPFRTGEKSENNVSI